MSAGRTGSSPALYGTGKGIITKWINACKEIVQYESYFTSSSVAVTLRDPSFRKGPSISAEYCSQLPWLHRHRAGFLVKGRGIDLQLRCLAGFKELRGHLREQRVAQRVLVLLAVRGDFLAVFIHLRRDIIRPSFTADEIIASPNSLTQQSVRDYFFVKLCIFCCLPFCIVVV